VTVLVCQSCAEFASPGTAWRAAIEQRIEECADAAESRMQANDQVFVQDIESLARDEEKSLAECRQVLNERYGAVS
jgi:hypothetical protein